MVKLSRFAAICICTPVLLGAGGTCTASKDSPTTAPAAATAPTTSTGASSSEPAKIYANQQAHFRIAYSADWKPEDNKDYVFSLVPADAKPGEPERRVSIDVPSLPPHLPGMITVSRVKDGYIKKQQKKLAECKLLEDIAVSVPQAKAQRVIVTGKLNNQPRTLAAVLMLHNDRVYIIRVDSDNEHYPQSKAVWDQVVSSLQWTR